MFEELNRMLEAKCIKLGYPTARRNSLEFDCQGQLFAWTTANPIEVVRTVRDKKLTKDLLREVGVAVPETYAVIGYKNRRKLPDVPENVVVKPTTSTGSRGVTLFPKKLSEAVTQALKHGTLALIEEYVPGVEYRALVTKDEVYVLEQLPPFVVGDGVSTVSQLIAAENHRRKRNPYNYGVRPSPKIDLDQVLSKDAKLVVSPFSIRPRGGVITNVTDQFPFKEEARRAMEAIPGMKVAGIDLKVDAGRMVVLEINSRPGFMSHIHPMYGRGYPVDEAIIKSFVD